jgi:protein-S-isoprenylcysteine O-methyltransferase Ste14
VKQKTKETIGYLVNGGSIAAFFYLTAVLDTPDWSRSLVYLGWVLLGLAIGLVVLSVAALAGNRGGALIRRGVYGVVRHPMYLGGMICYLSYSFFHLHWLILLISCANIGIVCWFVAQGERQSIARFGDAYTSYMEEVPRINLPAGLLRCLRRS